MELSDQIRRAIKHCGLTQYEIAKRTGVTKGALSRFMHGERDMTLRLLTRIAPVIGVRLVTDRPKGKGKPKGR